MFGRMLDMGTWIYADIYVPILYMVYTPMIVLLIPIILLEGTFGYFYIKRRYPISYLHVLFVFLIGNLFSTFAGFLISNLPIFDFPPPYSSTVFLIPFIFAYLLSCIIEYPWVYCGLRLFGDEVKIINTLFAVILANALSYLILFLLVIFM